MARDQYSWWSWAAGIAAAAALLTLTGCNPFAGREEKLPQGFFRVYADVRVKATGEIVKIDYVASCGAITSRWSYTTSSVIYGMAPHIMLMPTGSGEMIGVRTPDVCDSQDWMPSKVNDQMMANPPDDFLPLIMWYPDAGNIDFAIGYLSDKAYESPYAKIEVLSSGIAKSNLEEWRAWRKAAEDAFEPVGALPGPWGHQFLGRVGSSREEEAYLRSLNEGQHVWMDRCYSAGLLDLPEDGRERVLELMPDRDKAWTSSWELDQPQAKALYDVLNSLDFGGSRFASHRREDKELGVRRSTGGGAFFYGRMHAYHDIYPIVPYQYAAPDPGSEYAAVWRFELLTDPAWNGFGICGNQSPTPEALTEYSAGRTRQLVFGDAYPAPLAADPEKPRALEVVILEGEKVIEMKSHDGYGQIRVWRIPVIVGKSGQIMPDCCVR